MLGLVILIHLRYKNNMKQHLLILLFLISFKAFSITEHITLIQDAIDISRKLTIRVYENESFFVLREKMVCTRTY
jgi:hypothetical protein